VRIASSEMGSVDKLDQYFLTIVIFSFLFVQKRTRYFRSNEVKVKAMSCKRQYEKNQQGCIFNQT